MNTLPEKGGASAHAYLVDCIPDWSASSLGALAILSVLSCCAHENSKECVDPDQTPPSPLLTLFFDVLFHRTLKTLYDTYLRSVVAVFLTHLLLNICTVLLKTELNYRELYPLAWEIWRLDSNFSRHLFSPLQSELQTLPHKHCWGIESIVSHI